jgi:DNA-3-methyladenine glycosylase II
VVVSEAKDEASLAAAIEELRTRDKVLDHLVEVAGPIHHRPRAGGGHFSALARAIVFQQLSGTVIQAIFGHLESAVGGEVTAESIAATADAELLGAGLSHAKLASLRDLSAKVLDGSVDLEGSSVLDDDEIAEALVTVRGIGPWTVDVYLMFELRRLDVWPVGDLGVRQGYGVAWRVAPPPSARDLMPLGDPFRPYRTVAARYCWEALALFRRGTDPSLR